MGFYVVNNARHDHFNNKKLIYYWIFNSNWDNKKLAKCKFFVIWRRNICYFDTFANGGFFIFCRLEYEFLNKTNFV